MVAKIAPFARRVRVGAIETLLLNARSTGM